MIGGAPALAALAWLALLPSAPAARADGPAPGDPYCLGDYTGAPARAAPSIRFGIDGELAGAAGSAQLPTTPEDGARKEQAIQALRVGGRELVMRVNRLFWADGEAGIRAFQQTVAGYSRLGLDSEIQVRYHPGAGEEGDLTAWTAYVRHVVDVFGPERHVVDMTITNEVNLPGSSNTSDGSYQKAQDALILGIEAAHDEARRRHFDQLRFGFTFAYLHAYPTGDIAFWSYLGAHGGPAFAAALDWVGFDFYPGSLYPPAVPPPDTYGAETVKAMATMRRCFMALAGLGPRVALWVTENGIPTTGRSDAASAGAQAAAVEDIVRSVHDYGATYGVTDYRYFNLRDNQSDGESGLFSTVGLLYDDYTPKLAFSTYRGLMAAFGSPPPSAPAPAPAAPPSPGAACRRLLLVAVPSRRALGRSLRVSVTVDGRPVPRRRPPRHGPLRVPRPRAGGVRVVFATASGRRVVITLRLRGCDVVSRSLRVRGRA